MWIAICQKSIEKLESQLGKSKYRNRIEPFHGTSLIISDLTGSIDNGWLPYGRTGFVKAEGAEIIDKLKWVAQREGALAVAQAYEAFETFLYDIAASYGFNIDASRTQSELRLSKITEKNSFEEWKAVIREVYRKGNNREIINKLRSLGKGLEVAENKTRNTRNIDIISWYKVVEQIRHAATHSDYKIKKSVLNKFKPEEKKILVERIPGIETETGYLIKMDKPSATFAIKLFAEYAHAIYKALSIRSDLEWNNHIKN